MDDYGKLQPIADAIIKLEESGDIYCHTCGEVSCASTLLWNKLVEILKDNPDLFNPSKLK